MALSLAPISCNLYCVLKWCNVRAMSRENIKRWSKISTRTLHLVAVAGVGGGILFKLDKSLWLNYWWLALVSGVLLMLIDAVSNPVWLVQIRGLAVYLKLILLAAMVSYPAWGNYLLVLVIVISGVISHAPSSLRYYSIYHNKVIRSEADTKG